jgi:hypothetical protein
LGKSQGIRQQTPCKVIAILASFVVGHHSNVKS